MEKPSGSLISFMANKVKSDGGINLAQGIPAFDPPNELLEALENIIYQNTHQYAPGIGNHKLIDLLSNNYKIPKNQFLIVNGATEAISLLITYLSNKIEKPFSVLSFDPVYESYKHLPRIFNLPFHTIAFGSKGSINFDAVEESIHVNSVKLILIASPGNPLGKIWTEDEIIGIIELCTKHKVYVIFDAVYSDLYFNRAPYLPTNRINEYVFYVNAFSKKFSITGWRIGYLLAHNSHMNSIMDVHDYTGLCSPSLLQEALANYIEKNNFGIDYTAKLRSMLKKNYAKLAMELKNIGFTVIEAQGGYFIWAELPKQYRNGFNFALKLYEMERVAVVPGIHFSDNAVNIIRINIARKSDEIDEAIIRIKRFLNDEPKI